MNCLVLKTHKHDWWAQVGSNRVQISPVTAPKQTFQVSVLYFYSLHFNTNICTFYFCHFQDRLVTLVLMQLRGVNDLCFWSSHAAFPKSQDWCQSISAHHTWQTYQDRNRQRGRLKKWGKASQCLCSAKTLQLFATISLFSQCVAARDALPIQNDHIWRAGNETQLLNTFLVRLWTARTNPTDSTSKFNSLWIILMWCEVQLALHRNGR